MNIYKNFARVYDDFMSDAPYNQWEHYILKIWENLNHKPSLVLDLACGTGNMTSRLSKKGYDMIGIDISEDMLMMAKEKDDTILYLCQNITEFELYGTVDSIICICDGINYITDENDLFQLLKLVRNYLNPNGYFIFDINTEYNFKHIISQQSFSETFEDKAYICENYYFEDEKINEYSLTFFIKEDDTNNYKRFDEIHYERAYSINEIQNLIKKSGLNIIDIYDEMTFVPPTEDSTRIFFVVQKQCD